MFGSGPGSGEVQAFDPGTRALTLDLFPFGVGFTGGVNVAVSQFDLNADGMPDILVSAASGGGPRVVVLDGKTGAQLQSFFTFEPFFTGGVSLSLGAVIPGGAVNIIAGAGLGGGPAVKVFDPSTGELVRSFFAYDPGFRGGVSVAFGAPPGADTQLVTGAGPGGGPHVKIFSGTSGMEIQSFCAFEPTFSGGINVTVADFGQEIAGTMNVAAAPLSEGGPRIAIFGATTGTEQQSFFAFDPSFAGGVRLGAFGATILAGSGPEHEPQVNVFLNPDGIVNDTLFPFQPSLTGGVSVSGIPPLFVPPIVAPE